MSAKCTIATVHTYLLNTGFSGATKKLLQYVNELVDVRLDEVKLSFPIQSPQQVCGIIIIT